MHKATECGILKFILLEGAIRLKKKNKPISFDELLKELQGARSPEGEQRQVALEELFNEAFMSRCSSLKSFEEFLQKGNFTAKTQEDLNSIPDELMDRHVDRETHFTNWKAMLDQATAEYNG